jgi:hypothetical protein
MKKVQHFNYERNAKEMGSLLDSLVTQVGVAISNDPAQAEQAKSLVSSTVSDGIIAAVAANKGLIITGLAIFGLSMAVANVVITSIGLGIVNKKS